MSNIKEYIKNEDFVSIKKSIKTKEDTNIYIDETPLVIFAIQNRASFDIIKYLIDLDADLSYKTEEGVTILDEAIESRDLNLIKYLIEDKGLNVNKTDRNSGLTPLMLASCLNNLEVVKYLLDRGANVYQKDNNKLSALDYARKMRHMKIFKFLNDYLNR